MLNRMFSPGNTKLGRILNFSLPPVTTCPGATSWCKKHCYARKGYLKAGSVQKRWQENYELTQREDFVDIAVKLLERWKKKGYKIVRLHVAGDFYSQEYLNKWFEIARRLPDIKFVAYTRSWMLNFANKPANMLIYYSVDPETRHFPAKKMPLAFVPETLAPEGTHKCQYPKVTCDKCMFCYNGKGDVAFSIH